MRINTGWNTAFLALLLLPPLAACDGHEENALDKLANGANATQVDNSFAAEAQAVLEPLAPPAPGTPGGLPVDPVPIPEKGPIDPQGPQGAAQVVQGYYALLEDRQFADAQDFWSDHGPVGDQDDEAFAARFRGFSEIHANIGAPGQSEGAAGSIFITVPVQIYARIAATGKPWYALRQVTLRRVNNVDGSTEAQRRWHIESIAAYMPAQTAEAETVHAISATDGLSRRQ